MTDAPFALPLRVEVYDYSMFAVFETGSTLPFHRTSNRDRAEYLIRAVNSYAKMREALEKIAYSGSFVFQQDAPNYARAILKEIDNGR